MCVLKISGCYWFFTYLRIPCEYLSNQMINLPLYILEAPRRRKAGHDFICIDKSAWGTVGQGTLRKKIICGRKIYGKSAGAKRNLRIWPNVVSLV